jgi:spore germination protein GerM
MARRGIIAGIAALGAVIWVLSVAVPRWHAPTTTEPRVAGGGAVAAPERKITATLYFISEDGMSLVGVQREVGFGEPVAEQARRIVEAQLGAAPQPLASAIPEGTLLRGVFVSERGDAFVDVSADITSKHTGGALDELFTVYAIVNAVTVNLPAVTRVQILIDGRETDTLAGHVDLRHPLQKNLKWVKTS